MIFLFVSDLFRAAWDALAAAIKSELQALNTAALSLISTVLKVFDDLFEDSTSPKLATSAIIEEIAHFSLDQWENALKVDPSERSALENSATSLVTFLNVFGPKLFLDPEFSLVSVYSHFRIFGMLLNMKFPFRLAHGQHHEAECVPASRRFSFARYNLPFSS